MGRIIRFPLLAGDPSRTLRHARERSGLTHAEFAARIGHAIGRPHLFHATIRAWETGTCQPPTEVIQAAEQIAAQTPHDGPQPRSPRTMRAERIVANEESSDETMRRVKRSEIGPGTLEALYATTERLCSSYSTVLVPALIEETEQQLRYVLRMLDSRTTLSQHRELLVIAGWLSTLLGCLHNDVGRRRAAEAARDAAHHLGKEAGHPVLSCWAYELQAWFALTDGRFQDVTMFARAGQELGRDDSATVQLTLQEAKGWARLGDRDQAKAALQRGWSLLNRLPRPDHPEHHFVFDPAKYAFYAAPIYQWLGEYDRAEEHCNEVFAQCIAPDGTTKWPMRLADTENVMALIQLERGDLEGTLTYGNRALDHERQCGPSLLSGTSELVATIQHRHSDDPATQDFRERFNETCRRYRHPASI